MNRRESRPRAIYLYCIGNASDLAGLSGSGIDPRFVPFLSSCDDLAAVASEVPLEDFCGPQAERRLENLEWMSERAVRHERIVEASLTRGPVLPARFGTLFSSPEVLRRFVGMNRGEIRAFLEMARAHEEWGIKAFLDRDTATKWLAATAAAGAENVAPLSPGLRYLRERRAQTAAQAELHRWVADSCAAVVESLREYGREWHSRKVIDTPEGQDAAQVVLNGAILVGRGQIADLLARIDAVNAERNPQGLRFVATGPWPLYSFCPQLRTPR